MKLSPFATGLAISVSLANAYVGSMTHYTPSVGSCGTTHGPGDAIVALSQDVMQNGVNPNANPKCGTKISIFNPGTGQTHWAVIADTCMGCAIYDFDATDSVFTVVAPGADGVAVGVQWGGDAVGG